jgi:hypothetical protein
VDNEFVIGNSGTSINDFDNPVAEPGFTETDGTHFINEGLELEDGVVLEDAGVMEGGEILETNDAMEE